MVEFHRVPGNAHGPQHIWQASTQGSVAGQRFQATFELGNSSATRQRVNVIWNGGDGTGMTLCTFWIPPGQEKQLYAMTGFSKTAWPNATFIVEPATAAAQGSGTHEWLELDSVDFRKTNRAMPGTECWEPGSVTLDTEGFINAEWPSASAPMPEALTVTSGYAGFARYAGFEERTDALRLRSGLAGQGFSVEAGSLDPAAPRGPWSWVPGPGSEERALAGPHHSEAWLDGLTFYSDSFTGLGGPSVAPEPARTDPLTVIIGGTSSGTVTSSPGGITCAGSTVSCTGWFAEGSDVDLTAMPDPGMVFVGWIGCVPTPTDPLTCEIAVNGPKSVVAHFASPLQYYHLDVLGSVRMITNAAGAVVKRHDYFAFGEDIEGPTGDPRRFTGKERDAETELHYFGARYYRSVWGRFTSVDPLMDLELNVADPQGWNRYSYVGNRPTRFVDPDGRGWGLVFRIVKVVVTGGNAVAEAKAIWENGKTVLWSDAGLGERAKAAAEIVIGIRFRGGAADDVVQAAVRRSDNVVDAAKKLHGHHIFPQRADLAEAFERAGIDIDRFIMKIPAKLHREIHGGGARGGKWNAAWEAFFKKNPNASDQDIYKYAEKLIADFQLPGGG